MKQFFIILVLCVAACAGTSTLTGRITDSQGNPLNGTLVMSLPVPAQDPTTSTAIAPSPVFFRVIYGQISATAPLYDVNTITPSGLYYVARAYNTQGMLQFYGNYVVTGATFDLGAATPTSITTSNISYLSPGFTNGNNTWTGINIFTQPITAPGFVSSCTPTATIGYGRLCKTDQICWRNQGNSGDACLSLNFADQLAFFGGLHLVGGDLRVDGLATIGGTLSVGGGTALATSNQSGTGNLCLVSNCQLVTPALNGVTISGTPSAGQTLTATSPSAASWATPSAGIQASSITLLGAPVNISVGTVTVLTKNVTMPAVGCPCRAFVSYGLNLDTGNSGEASATVFDGTNRFATGSMNTTGSASDFAINASSYSTGTYANSASITFTLQAATTMAGTTNVHVNNANSLGQASYMNVAIFTSN